ncbi:MAG TPA: hypothetical protein VMU26_13320 [Candidatus Polarisedimenticolia bacterium]|nr:hypothetical protein [Candidatus Polarisedimenticolia bacterium]
MQCDGFGSSASTDVSGREINFRTVTAEAAVATARLYSQDELRARIMGSRQRQSQLPPFLSTVQDRERLSRQNIVATLGLG